MASTQAVSNHLLGTKILLVLYGIIGLVPKFEAVDPIGSQWFYFGGVTLLGYLYLYSSRDRLPGVFLSKKMKLFFGAYLLFIVLATLSLTVAINVSEGVKDLSRLVITAAAVIQLYVLFSQNAKALFEFMAKVIQLVVIVIGIQIVFYFIDNFQVIRSTTLLKGTELFFGNRNVTAAALAIQLPMVIYGILRFERRWKYISLVALFLGVTALFYIGARSALLSFSIIMTVLIIYLIYDGRIHNTLTRNIKQIILPVFGILIIGGLLVLNTNRIVTGQMNSYTQILSTPSLDKTGKIFVPDKKVARSSGFDNGRLIYFEMATDDILANPLLGVGIGNWKLSNKDKFFAASRIDKFIYPLRVHSDLLQVFAETGILGGIAYLLMLAVLAFGILALLFRKSDKEERWIYLTLTLALMAYGVDAALNFPLERTPIQGLFAIIAASIVVFIGIEASQKAALKQLPITKAMLLGIGIVLLTATVFSFMKYQSYVNQNYILSDILDKNLMTDRYAYSYEQALDRLDGFYEIAGVGRPNEHVKGMYAMSEGRIDLALDHLSKSIAQAPNHYESKMLKAIIYGQKKVDNDSAIFYAKQGFEKYPSIKNNYVILLNAYRAQGDTLNYFKTYDTYLAFDPNDIQQWKAKSTRVMEFYNDPRKAADVIEQGLQYNPQDSSLISLKERFTTRERETDIRGWYKRAFELIAENKRAEAKVEFLKILEVTPSNNPTLLNLGIIEIKLKQYQEAIEHLSKVIAAKAFKDGRPEYNRGLAYDRLGMEDKAKRDYSRSKALGYPLAQKLPANKLN